MTDSRDSFLINGEPLPQPKPIVTSGLEPINVSWDPSAIYVTDAYGSRREFQPALSDHDQALLAWARLPLWRRLSTRRP